MESIHKIIGRNIKAHRIAMGLSIEEISEMLDLSPSFWGLMERGERGTRIVNLLKIAEIFDISLNELVTDSEISDNKDTKFLKLVKSLTCDFDDGKKEALISMIKALKKIE